jgi:DNA-binding GntR family transcriptional regulator
MPEDVTSLYKLIVVTLQEEIERSAYEPPGKFPWKAELCDRFAVGRVTVRLALS